MKLATFIAMLVGISHVATAQNYCGFDQIRALHFQSHQERAAEAELNYQIVNQMNTLRNGQRSGVVTVPVVVHVLHQNGEENIPDSQIETAIEQLNAAFENVAPLSNPDGIDTEIRFCLAGTDPNGEFTTGIVRVETEYTNAFVPSQEQAMKDASRWDPLSYLNIWLIKELIREPNNTGVVGFSSFPDQHGGDLDGVVVEAGFFGTTLEYSKVHIHEIGHYLGLYHTFQDGCENDDCQTSGDWICDTPPDQQAFSILCYDGVNSCDTDDDDLSENNPFRPVELGGLGDVPDEKDNYMDYSSLFCMNQFTVEQALRMKAVLTDVRASLLEGDRCATPCETPFEVDVESSGSETEVGTPIAFVVTGGPYAGVNWYVDDEISDTGDSFTFPASAEGQFEILAEIYNDEIGCIQEFIFTISVGCGVSAFFESSTSNVGLNMELSFLNTSEGVTSYNWTVNGATVGSDPELIYNFNQEGISVVTLAVSNGLCTDTYSWSINVGDCVSGNESNMWFFQLSQSANFHGFDFNQSGADILVPDYFDFENFAHNKSSYCDMAGNLKYASNGDKIFDSTIEPLPNGDIQGGISAHYGGCFIAVPESENLVYFFSSAQQEQFTQGLRYSILDNDLNNGLGDVTNVKDELIEVTNTESFATVRHCNLRDFWLTFYDFQEGNFKAYLVDPSGIASEPVVSDIQLNLDNIYRTFPFEVNGPGNKIMIGYYILEFDPATGEASILHEIESETMLAYSFSKGEQYVYYMAGDIDVTLYQIDLFDDPADWDLNADIVYEGDITDFGKGFQLAPDGKIYHAADLSAWIGVIENPDLPAGEVVYDPNFAFVNATINGFSNFHHAYVYGPSLYTAGPLEVCAGEEHEYSIFASDCLNEIVGWEVFGNANISENENGSVQLTFEEEGTVQLVSSVSLSCGIVADTLNITVSSGTPLTLSANQPICENESLELDAGDGYDTYEWQDGSTGQTYTAEAGETVQLTAAVGACSYSQTLEIGPEITASIDLGEDLFLCDGEIVVLDAGSNFSDFVWQDGTLGSTYTVYEDGTYFVTANTPCFVTDTVVVTDCDQEINIVNELNAFGDRLMPNPVTTWLKLIIGTPAEQWTIQDASGRIIEQGSLNGRVQLEINTQQYAAGMYFLKLEGPEPRVLEFIKVD